MVLSRVYIVFLNLVETLNDVTKTDDAGAAVDSLMAGVGPCTGDLYLATPHHITTHHISPHHTPPHHTI